MGACAAGLLCAAWVTDSERPGYAAALSAARYADPKIMAELAALNTGGVL